MVEGPAEDKEEEEEEEDILDGTLSVRYNRWRARQFHHFKRDMGGTSTQRRKG